MKIIKYKNNRYIRLANQMYIVAQSEPCITIGHLSKVTNPSLVRKVLCHGKTMEGSLSDGKLKEFEEN